MSGPKIGNPAIPGFSQLLSKRPDQFAPGYWPGTFRKARGTSVLTDAGTKYLDFSISGIGANILGYSNPRLVRALRRAVSSGTSTSLSSWDEWALAEDLLSMHPWADRVRYARSGGEAMAVAIRIARASTGRDTVLFSGYHGWHDWYLAANLADEHALDGVHIAGLGTRGVPRGLAGSAYSFPAFDAAALRKKLESLQGRVAAIVVEPARLEEPPEGYLDLLSRLAEQESAVLIFDEISSGFRFFNGGLHLKYGVNPDLVVYAKAISNGVPMAAVVGQASVMEAVNRTFVSSTSWSERLGPVAARAVLEEFRRSNIPEQLTLVADFVGRAWEEAAEVAKLDISITGFGGIRYLRFDERNRELATALSQEMLRRGYLHSPRFYANVEQARHLRGFRRALLSAFVAIGHRLRKNTLPSGLQLRSEGFVPFNPGSTFNA